MSEPELKHNDEVEQLIIEHGGDVHAAISALLLDRNFLIKELEYAAIAMGHGFARGWRPKSLRSEH
jgi:hypothetical protein